MGLVLHLRGKAVILADPARRPVALIGDGAFQMTAQQALAPLLVPSALDNFKLTWPEDFGLAARLLETR